MNTTSFNWIHSNAMAFQLENKLFYFYCTKYSNRVEWESGSNNGFVQEWLFSMCVTNLRDLVGSDLVGGQTIGTIAPQMH